MNNQTIVIMGFMGSGKTTVAYGLSRQLNCRAIDLDHMITQSESRGPREIIEQDGEEVFRRIETEILRQVLKEASARVVAVGGGAWTIAENRKMIAEHGAFTVWLDAPFELCWKRIETGREARPLARSRELAQALYTARRQFYALADARIPVSENESAEAIATKVVGAVARLNAKN
jgi:shikimate kinase